MFTPVGKKKLLLEQKFGKSIEPLKTVEEEAKEPRPIRPKRDANEDRFQPKASVASTAKLENALRSVGIEGDVFNRIMESTSRYRPERDSVVMKAFQTKNMSYHLFRHHLNAAFWLSFSDDEFNCLIKYFDPKENGVIDGYEFIVAYVRLTGMLKDQQGLISREQQEIFDKKQKAQEQQVQLELEKKQELAADFEFSEEQRERALAKLDKAAFKFDPQKSASLEGFDVDSMKPFFFREMVKLTFGLALDRQELGAVLKEFDSKMDGKSMVPSARFLKFFFRRGYEARDKARADQRRKQKEMDREAEEEHLKKIEALSLNANVDIDYNFSTRDQEVANEKIRVAAKKYDKAAPGSVSLDGFECDSLGPGEFKNLVLRVFMLNLNAGELGYVVQKYDVKKIGAVWCKRFLNEFLRLGIEERHKTHMEQLERQKQLDEEAHQAHIRKMADVVQSQSVKVAPEFEESDIQSVIAKLTDAAVKFDKGKGGTLMSFDVESLDALDFKKALKRTFNLSFSPQEMAAAMRYFDKKGTGRVHCHSFVTTFVMLGAREKGRLREEQLRLNREGEKLAKEEEERKKFDLSKLEDDDDIEPTESDSFTAFEKLTDAATKYDPAHPAARSLIAFDRKSMKPAEFREVCRRVFNLRLTGPEALVIFQHVDKNPEEVKFAPGYQAPDLNCGDFLKFFLRTGLEERDKLHKAQIEKQRREDKEREEAHLKAVEELETRGTFSIDKNFTEEDEKSIMEKIQHVAAGFDKAHPSSPSLEAFEVYYMPVGLFRENIFKVWRITASPKEMGYLAHIFPDKKKSGKEINVREFMLKFLAIGNKARFEARREFLQKTRAMQKAAKEEEEQKLAAQWAKAELAVDYQFTVSDYNTAEAKMAAASTLYDATHPSAPCLDGFSGGPIKPGVFRELMRRAFNVWFEPKELGAVVRKFKHSSSRELVDGKKFLIKFMSLGFEARARMKSQRLDEMRRVESERKQEAERKLRAASLRNEIDVASEYTAADRETALKKLTAASALYDKNAPGCVALDAFDAAYLTPGMFRESLKRTFNLIFTAPQLAAIIAEFDNGSGNVDSQRFVIHFIKSGAAERHQLKTIQLEKQRHDDHMRKTEHERKMKEAEEKSLLKITYDFTPEQRKSAFEKLAKAAKKFDKGHPGSMSLEGFEQKSLRPHVFREMMKRTFGVILDNEELGAVMKHFDERSAGVINSKKFLNYFLQLGIAERHADHAMNLNKLRNDAAMREREHEEKMAAQWAKMEISVADKFTQEQYDSAMEKLSVAAFKFDPASPGPMGLTAFEAKTLSPAIFREMLRRSFNLKVTDEELAALVKEFSGKDGKNIKCADFLIRFNAIGCARRDEFRLNQLEKQRQQNFVAETEHVRKMIEADEKVELKLDYDYSKEDFDGALEKIRVIAENYDRSHASAPSLEGFMGTNMKPVEFKDMMMRTFRCNLNIKELAALFEFFPAEEQTGEEEAAEEDDEETNEADGSGSKRKKKKSVRRPVDAPALAAVDPSLIPEPVPRIDNKQFLNYFNKIQMYEQSQRRIARIEKERLLLRQQKEHEEELERKKLQKEVDKLIFTDADKVTLTEKIRKTAQEYSIDPNVYVEACQGFKGPALPPKFFRELYHRVFHIRLSFPETGVLLGILDPSGIGSFDGGRFLNWFYKLARKEEKFMLGESEEHITWELMNGQNDVKKVLGGTGTVGAATLKAKKKAKASAFSSSSSSSSSAAGAADSFDPFESEEEDERDAMRQRGSNGKYKKPKSTTTAQPQAHVPWSGAGHHNKKGSLGGDNEGGDFKTFTNATLSQSWFLPSIVAAGSSSVAEATTGGNNSEHQDPYPYGELDSYNGGDSAYYDAGTVSSLGILSAKSGKTSYGTGQDRGGGGGGKGGDDENSLTHLTRIFMAEDIESLSKPGKKNKKGQNGMSSSSSTALDEYLRDVNSRGASRRAQKQQRQLRSTSAGTDEGFGDTSSAMDPSSSGRQLTKKPLKHAASSSTLVAGTAGSSSSDDAAKDSLSKTAPLPIATAAPGVTSSSASTGSNHSKVSKISVGKSKISIAGGLLPPPVVASPVRHVTTLEPLSTTGPQTDEATNRPGEGDTSGGASVSASSVSFVDRHKEEEKFLSSLFDDDMNTMRNSHRSGKSGAGGTGSVGSSSSAAAAARIKEIYTTVELANKKKEKKATVNANKKKLQQLEQGASAADTGGGGGFFFSTLLGSGATVPITENLTTATIEDGSVTSKAATVDAVEARGRLTTELFDLRTTTSLNKKSIKSTNRNTNDTRVEDAAKSVLNNNNNNNSSSPVAANRATQEPANIGPV